MPCRPGVERVERVERVEFSLNLNLCLYVPMWSLLSLYKSLLVFVNKTIIFHVLGLIGA